MDKQVKYRMKLRNLAENALVRFYNSSFWFHVYYKHTKGFKKELELTGKRVRDRRKELIGR